eukprot:g2798.t1
MLTPASRPGGLTMIQWERSMEMPAEEEAIINNPSTVLQRYTGSNKIAKQIMMRKINVVCPPGPLGARMVPGPGDIGLRVQSFTLLDSGEPGPIESQGVTVGMYLHQVDDLLNCGDIKSADLLRVLMLRTKQKRTLIFSGIPSVRALEWMVLESFGRHRKARAVRRIQKAFYEWRDRGCFSMKKIQTTLGLDLKLSVLTAAGLPPRKKSGENRRTRVLVVVGEVGEKWDMKIAKANRRGFAARQIVHTKSREKDIDLVFAKTLWMRLDGVQRPEISLRIVDEEKIENDSETFARTGERVQLVKRVIAECERVLKPGVRFLNPVEVPLRSCAPELNDWAASLIMGWERPLSCNLDVRGSADVLQLPRRRYITVKCPSGPLGCTMQAGFGGISCRVAQFVLIDGVAGPLESQGVELGMYLQSNGEENLSEIEFTVIKNILKKTQNQKERLLTFCTRPSKAAMKLTLMGYFGNNDPKFIRIRAARVIQKVARLFLERISKKESQKANSNIVTNAKATVEEDLGSQVFVVLREGYEIVLPPTFSKASDTNRKLILSRAILKILVGEKGQAWSEKYDAAVKAKILKGRMKRTKKRVQLLRNSKNITWGGQNLVLDTVGLIKPELTIRVICKKDKVRRGGHSPAEVIIGQAEVSIPKNERTKTETVYLRSMYQTSPSGQLTLEWERIVGHSSFAFTENEYDNTSKPEIIVALVKPGPLGAAFGPGFGGVGVRIAYFKLLADGQPGPIEMYGIKAGMFLVGIDNEKVGNLVYEDAMMMLKSKRDNYFGTQVRLVFSSKPSEGAMQRGVVQQMKKRNRDSACIVIQRAIRRWLLELDGKRNRRSSFSDSKLEDYPKRTIRLGSDLRISILKVFGLPKSGRDNGREREYLFEATAGEEGEDVKRKDARSPPTGSSSYKYRVTWPVQDKKSVLQWMNKSKWLSLHGLKKPEVSFVIYEQDKYGVRKSKESKETKHRKELKRNKSILCQGILRIIDKRHSENVVTIALATLLGSPCGFLELKWERTLAPSTIGSDNPQDEQQFQELKLLGKMRRRALVIKLQPGPLYCRMTQGFGGFGAKVAAFSLSRDGLPGPLEAQGVLPGDYITSMVGASLTAEGRKAGLLSDGEIGSLQYLDVMSILRATARQYREITFSSRPTDSAMQKATVALLLGQSQVKAVRMIQSMFRRRSAVRLKRRKSIERYRSSEKEKAAVEAKKLVDAIIFKAESSRFTTNFTREPLRKSMSIRITVGEVSELLGPRRGDRQSKMFARVVVGEIGEPWEQKLSRATKGFTKKIPCSKAQDTSHIKKSWLPSWSDETLILSLKRISKPELSIKVYDVIMTNENVLEIPQCEATIPVGKARSSGGIISVPWRSDSEIEWTGNLQLSWERLVGTRSSNDSTVSRRKKLRTISSVTSLEPLRRIQCICPPGPLGVRLAAGVGGIGCRVSQFLLVNNEPGVLERAGVSPGMYLSKLSGDISVSKMKFASALAALHRAANQKRMLDFSTLPDKEALRISVVKFLNEKRREGAINLIKRFIRMKLERMRLEDLKAGHVQAPKRIIGDDLIITLVNAEGLDVERGRKKSVSNRKIVLQAVTGETGYTWESKVLHAKPRAKFLRRSQRFPRFSSVAGVPRMNEVEWKKGNNKLQLSIKGIENPELTLRLYEVQTSRKDASIQQESVLCFAVFDIKHKRSGNNITVLDLKSLHGHKRGKISFLWERCMHLQKNDEKPIRKSRRPPERQITVKVPAGSLGVQLAPSIGDIGARLESYLLVNGMPGPLEREKVQLGSYIVKLDGNSDIGDMPYNDILKLLLARKTKSKSFTFSTRPSDHVMKLATIEALSYDRRERAVTVLQQIFRSRRATNKKRTAPIEDGNEIKMELSKSVRFLVLFLQGLPSSKSEQKEYQPSVYLEGVVGELGQRWEKKLELASSLRNIPGRGSRTCVTQRFPKETRVDCEESFWLKVAALQKPEITFRVIEETGRKIIKRRFIAEFSCPLPEERVSDGALAIPLKSFLSPFEVTHSEAMAIITWERPVEGFFDPTKLDDGGAKRKRRDTRVVVKSSEDPLAVQLQRGFGGNGARVSGFVLANGAPGVLETAGVRLGAYLNRVNSFDVSVLPFGEVLQRLRDLKTQFNQELVLDFSSHPTNEAMTHATLSAMGLDSGADTAARIIQRLVRRNLKMTGDGFDTDEEKRAVRNSITVSLSMNNLGMQFTPGPRRRGIILQSISRKRGSAENYQVLRNSGVRPGMCMALYNGTNVTKMRFHDVISLIIKDTKSKKHRTRVMTFRTLGMNALQILAIDAFLLSTDETSAIKIQNIWRQHRIRRRDRETKGMKRNNAAIDIQRIHRGNVARIHRKRNSAAIDIQRIHRGNVDRIHRKRSSAAIDIQRIYRGNVDRIQVKRHNAAIDIQRIHRGRADRIQVKRHNAAIDIQRIHRGRADRMKERASGGQNEELPDEWVVARYAYERSEQDELTLVKGMVLRVLDRGDDGWFLGETPDKKQKGLFPGNYVWTRQEHAAMRIQRASRNGRSRLQMKRREKAAITIQKKFRELRAHINTEEDIEDDYVIAIADYVPEEEDELTLVKGMELRVVQRHDDGWWEGETPVGQFGFFPENFTKPFDRRIAAATKIQARARAHTARRSHTGNRKAATLVQAQFRGWQARREMGLHKEERILSASQERTLSVSQERTLSASRSLILSRSSAMMSASEEEECVRVVHNFDGEEEGDIAIKREPYDRRYNAAVRIQSRYRGMTVRMIEGDVHDHQAATKIQARYRGTRGRRLAFSLNQRWTMAIRIQARHRGVMARRRLSMRPIKENEEEFQDEEYSNKDDESFDDSYVMGHRNAQHRLAKLGKKEADVQMDDEGDGDVVRLMAGMQVTVVYGKGFQVAFPNTAHKFSGVIRFVSTAELVIDFGAAAGGDMAFVPDKTTGRLVDPDGWDVRIMARNEGGRLAVSRRRFMGAYFGDENGLGESRPISIREDVPLSDEGMRPFSNLKRSLSGSSPDRVGSISPHPVTARAKTRIISRQPMMMDGKQMVLELKQSPGSDEVKMSIVEKSSNSEPLLIISTADLVKQALRRQNYETASDNLNLETKSKEAKSKETKTLKSTSRHLYCVVFKKGSLGVVLQEEEFGNVVVGEVIAGEMAQRQGVRVGDTIFSIANKDVRKLGYDETIATLQSTRRPFEVQFLRQHAAAKSVQRKWRESFKKRDENTNFDHSFDSKTSRSNSPLHPELAALTIQRYVRSKTKDGRWRRELKRKNPHVTPRSLTGSASDLEFYEEATSKVQAIFRGRRERIIKKKKTNAAMKIQKIQRGRFVRSRRRDARWRSELKKANPRVTPRGRNVRVTTGYHSRSDSPSHPELAALTIQRYVRSKTKDGRWRRELKRKNPHVTPRSLTGSASDLEFYEEATSKVQAIFRGRRERIIKKKKTNAAMKIQKIQRGRFVRSRRRDARWRSELKKANPRVTPRGRNVRVTTGYHSRSDSPSHPELAALTIQRYVRSKTKDGRWRRELKRKNPHVTPRGKNVRVTTGYQSEDVSKDEGIEWHTVDDDDSLTGNRRRQKIEATTIEKDSLKNEKIKRDRVLKKKKENAAKLKRMDAHVTRMKAARAAREREAAILAGKLKKENAAITIQKIQRGRSSRSRSKGKEYRNSKMQGKAGVAQKRAKEKQLEKEGDFVSSGEHESEAQDGYSSDSTLSIEGARNKRKEIRGGPQNLEAREAARAKKAQEDRLKREEVWKQSDKQYRLKRREDRERRLKERAAKKQAEAQLARDSPIPRFVNRLYGLKQHEKARQARLDLMIAQKNRERRKKEEAENILGPLSKSSPRKRIPRKKKKRRKTQSRKTGGRKKLSPLHISSGKQKKAQLERLRWRDETSMIRTRMLGQKKKERIEKNRRKRQRELATSSFAQNIKDLPLEKGFQTRLPEIGTSDYTRILGDLGFSKGEISKFERAGAPPPEKPKTLLKVRSNAAKNKRLKPLFNSKGNLARKERNDAAKRKKGKAVVEKRSARNKVPKKRSKRTLVSVKPIVREATSETKQPSVIHTMEENGFSSTSSAASNVYNSIDTILPCKSEQESIESMKKLLEELEKQNMQLEEENKKLR